jgi:hypothetical protein
MRLVIEPEHDSHYHIPHQGLWFVLMLIAIWMLLGKDVGTVHPLQRNQCVIAYSSTLMPMA